MAGKVTLMVNRSSLDPLEEARARVKLRYAKAKPVHPGPGTIGTAAMRLTRKAASIDDYRIEDFEVAGYEPHAAIQADVAV